VRIDYKKENSGFEDDAQAKGVSPKTAKVAKKSITPSLFYLFFLSVLASLRENPDFVSF
jgi:hypothetical protein